jgi:hypothetical protein
LAILRLAVLLRRGLAILRLVVVLRSSADVALVEGVWTTSSISIVSMSVYLSPYLNISAIGGFVEL